MSENDRKRELIIESAMKRFSHFGIQKTTMNEIADDIAVTQPSLYYYFPDKTSLVVAVVGRILNDYFAELETELNKVCCVRDIFFKIIDFRQSFVKRYFMLHLTDPSADSVIRESCQELLTRSRQREIDMLASEIKAWTDKGELETTDVNKACALYLDSLTGLGMWTISRSSPKIYPENEQLEYAAQRQRELAEVFLRGLKYKGSNTCKV